MRVHTLDDGCRLAYELIGPAAAPPLLLLHALGTDRGLWESQVGGFSAWARVITVDARGHGGSDAPPGPYSIARLGRDALSLLDALAVTRADVCGVSIGGVTGLWLAVHAPDRVRRLVLANTAARIGTAALWAERQRLAATGVAGLVEPTLSRWFTPAFRAASAEVVARRRDTLLRTSSAGYVGAFAALGEADLRAEAGQVRAPTLVVTGRHDVSTPPADGAFLASVIAGASLVELDAAHLANVEQPTAFNAAVGQFLRS